MSTRPSALLCDKAFHDNGRIRCGRSPSGRQLGELCGHVKFCRTYGWWEQTAQAADCPLKNPPEKPEKEAKKHES